MKFLNHMRRNVHSSRHTMLQKRYLNSTNRNTGIELELIVPDLKSRRQLKQHLVQKLAKHNLSFSKWKIIKDGSISCGKFGIEIVSPKRIYLMNRKMSYFICVKHWMRWVQSLIFQPVFMFTAMRWLYPWTNRVKLLCCMVSLSLSSIRMFIRHEEQIQMNTVDLCRTLIHILRNIKDWFDDFHHRFNDPLRSWVLFNPDYKYHKLNFNNLREWDVLNTIENR
eukprot:340104_1